MGSQPCDNRFDIEACCVTMLPSRKKGESLVLPNLKLKLVLEIVYDERFVTFSYGGRVGMGRHTAIRYLKNSVENPSCQFDDWHVNKLCLFIEEKIKDVSLIGLIKRLFECEVVQSEGFKFDSQIENEAREIFRTWTDEVVQDFLGSLEERWEWQWMLTAGDFLSLRHIRDQLPQELVDAYDKFQEQVDKYLSPVQARKAFEKEEKRVEEEEERKYAKSTIEDLTRLCMKVDAPVELVRKAVKMAGFTNNMGCPRLIKLLIALEDTDIIKWYAGVGRRWLDFFCRCHNFKMVKSVVTYHLRFSCILTLAEKHESTKREAIKHYTKDFKVSDFNGNEKCTSPQKESLIAWEIKIFRIQGLLASDEPLCSCIGHFCDRIDTVYYRVRLLQNCLNVNPSVEDKWVPGMGAIHESLNRKCLPLCSHHINDLYMGNITLQDIDCTAFVDLQMSLSFVVMNPPVKRIKDQLPQGLVDAYNKFKANDDKI
ncbi:nuclear intron maturase 3 [Quercus suber]|uniref:Nuclear intron maturase 3 n=1 Tax=Quercus suber TaxID=58331 RepID=A0AAW0JD61_QUESU